ncbi:MAG: PEP-CTERM sorting domain-containing protein [Caldimonas sp.]
MSHRLTKLALAAAAAACVAGGSANASTVNYSTTDAPVTNLDSLTGYMTSGADMSGLTVMATFSGGLTQSLAWATTGASSGGVTGTGWGLSLNGDSYGGNWNFTFDPQYSLGQLTKLVLDGHTGLTVLDRTEPSPGTPDSASGLDFSFAGGTCGSCVADAIYSGVTSIGGAVAVGDLWQILTVNFLDRTGPDADWAFHQDTDNDGRYVPGVPEPETYALILGGLGLVGWMGKRRRRSA